jgi:hypothetical protein
LLSQYGNFIGELVGCIISVVSVFLLYNTLKAQQKTSEIQQQALEKQEEISKTERFETTFFNLLETRQKQTNEITGYFKFLENDFSANTKKRINEDFFMYSLVAIGNINKSIEYNEYLGMYENDMERINHDIEECYNSDNYSGEQDADGKEKQIRKEEKLKYVNKFYNITKGKWDEIHPLSKGEKVKYVYELFFKKHRYAVEPYVENLGLIIKFVKDKISEKEKAKEYISFLKVQISYFEETLLFYHAVYCENFCSLLKEFDFLEKFAENKLVVSQSV